MFESLNVNADDITDDCNDMSGTESNDSATVINSEDPEKSIQATIIFDSDSQRSYVTRHIKESLNLPTIKKETLMIKTFGSSVGQLQMHNLVQLTVKGEDSNHIVQLNAFAISTICSPLI
ncbi:Hypothetical predicted protein [Paramuricea clavata]|uniref:DUF1758 domain-containing protein n=1 Tax=Paramuricea clavata TaxID=317549 RepID=A0A6S7HHR2_PARCT|nr:Hypothetical predicted protein [Paramuricea clavata]